MLGLFHALSLLAMPSGGGLHAWRTQAGATGGQKMLNGHSPAIINAMPPALAAEPSCPLHAVSNHGREALKQI